MNKGLSFLHSLRGAASCLLLASLLFGTAAAQTSMPVPCGSFEQWSTHPGYSVTAGFIPVSVYSSFSTPTGWDYLSYPVNQSISLGITTVTVDTQLPLIKASQESGSVPAGNSAVKLQSFKLSDIISSAVYAVAAGSIDPELTSEVFPSILTTGTVDIDRFIPMMGSLISNMGNTGALLSSLADIDVNYLVSGGIALGSFEPTYLSGSYKYHSAVGGDNGGVVILGTRYNPLLHRREVVGGGANIALTDHSSYTAFTVDYHSLHDYDASFAEQAPDSLIVMLISSASQNRQQGSWMCVDNLNLWHVDPPEPPRHDDGGHLRSRGRGDGYRRGGLSQSRPRAVHGEVCRRRGAAEAVLQRRTADAVRKGRGCDACPPPPRQRGVPAAGGHPRGQRGEEDRRELIALRVPHYIIFDSSVFGSLQG